MHSLVMIGKPVVAKVSKSISKLMKKKAKGESHMVAIIIIMVIVIGIGVFFKEQLTLLVTSLFEKLSGFLNDI